MRGNFAVDHVALALANGAHIGGDFAGYDAEARAPARQMRDPCAPNWQTMDVVLRWVIIGIVALAAWQRHSAAQDYPTHSVTILVPFVPGGGTDLIARAVGHKLEQRLGETFVVENRPPS
jgi:hypothetical protein